MSVAEFRVLGPLSLSIAGQSVPLHGAKQQVILGTLLLCHGRRVSLARLADTVWEHHPPVTARKQIRNAVSGLRGVLQAAGAAVSHEADGYRLDIGDAALDARTFQEHCARARFCLEQGQDNDAGTELRAALSLWRGPVLSGLDRSGLRAQTAVLEEQRLAVLEEWAELELARGRHAALIGELSAVVAEHPLRERLVAQFVLALFHSGDRARAFAVHERTRRKLADTLGLDPGPELQDAHQRMLADDAGAPGPAPAPVPERTAVPRAQLPGNLPADPRHFTGRAAVRRRLLDLACRDDGPGAVRTALIEGMAGVGKTALAVHVAHRLMPRYPDGALFLDLCGHSTAAAPLSPAAALVQLLRAAGVETGGPGAVEGLSVAELSGLWRSWLAGRSVLLVLDDAAGTGQIRPLLADGAGCLTLVTSRRSLTGLSAARPHFLDPFSREEARELFRRLADDGSGWPTGRQEARPDEVDGLLGHCDDHPLAIAAAAAKLRHRPAWSVGYLAARLADPDRRLAELRTEDGGLLNRIDLSCSGLHPDQQRLLRLLGLMVTPVVNAHSAAALCGLPVQRTEELLEGLVDEHLLQQPEAGHYRVPGLVQAYCRQLSRRLDTPEDRESAFKGLHDFYLERQLILSYAGDPCPLQPSWDSI
ncbi:BTAD domain-containing putative transcriptional regulator [Streptomyces sp. NPDC001404]|uniref:AfsR/SARP family transcriptional regulator n=1 Tax=Streptomyces sp. NPDC001404 TaxID=3364571 RepID=UPI003691454B